MIRSMTGFGLSKSLKKDSEVFIEIKGVNHRFLEVSIKPNDLGNELDQYIRNSITKSVNRGKVDVRIKLALVISKMFLEYLMLRLHIN